MALSLAVAKAIIGLIPKPGTWTCQPLASGAVLLVTCGARGRSGGASVSCGVGGRAKLLTKMSVNAGRGFGVNSDDPAGDDDKIPVALIQKLAKETADLLRDLPILEDVSLTEQTKFRRVRNLEGQISQLGDWASKGKEDVAGVLYAMQHMIRSCIGTYLGEGLTTEVFELEGPVALLLRSTERTKSAVARYRSAYEAAAAVSGKAAGGAAATEEADAGKAAGGAAATEEADAGKAAGGAAATEEADAGKAAGGAAATEEADAGKDADHQEGHSDADADKAAP